MNNQKQILLGIQNYSDMMAVPPSQEQSAGLFGPVPTGCIGSGMSPEERLSWYVSILPYLEQETLYRQFDCEKNYAENRKAAEAIMKILQCPAFSASGHNSPITTYIASAGVGEDAAKRPIGAPGNGFMGYDRAISWAAITDGTSNTIAIWESHQMVGPWAQGGPSTLRGGADASGNNVNMLKASPLHGGNEFLVGFADGATRSISYSIDPQMLAAMLTIAGGETVTFE